MAKVVFLIQMLQTFGGRCNRFFRDIRLKILRLPIFNFFISNLFSCLPKVNHVIKSCKEPFFSDNSFIDGTCQNQYLLSEPSQQ